MHYRIHTYMYILLLKDIKQELTKHTEVMSTLANTAFPDKQHHFFST